ncbi:MAG: GldG family protein [Verrucomicrobia bacterium]|nr:GldG family protein [Verrucomicrobiota bacterium]
MKLFRHRFWLRFNTGAALLLALAIALMVNYLSYRHYYRTDWSAKQFYSLSPKTTGLLESLEKPVEVTVFFQPGNVLYEDIYNLLREYQFCSKQLNIQWVDPDRDIAQTEELAVKYQVSEPNVVVFDYEGRKTYKRADEIAKIDASKGAPKIVAFNGEQAFSSAIQEVLQETVPVACFLAGHGERDIENFDPRTGFSGVAQLIERDNVTVRKLELSVEKQIPADCNVLIVAGAAQSMSPAEAELIGAWLRRNGRLLVLADARRTSGLELLLREWGVLLSDDLVIDPVRTLTGREVFASAYNRHPITEKLSATAAIFHLPRSVRPDPAQTRQTAEDRPQVTPLALSSKSSWAERQLDQSPAQYDPETDQPGPISLAVAVEKGATSGRLDMQIRPARIVVFGDSGFVSNGGLTGGDTSLFMSSLNWLLDREQLMAIAPKAVNDTRLELTRTDIQKLFWITVWGIPSLAAAVGIVLWFRRRK